MFYTVNSVTVSSVAVCCWIIIYMGMWNFPVSAKNREMGSFMT